METITVEAKEVPAKRKRGRPRKNKPSQIADGLTIKQKTFVKEYIETKGNGTQAALKAYNTEDENTAAQIASDNLRNPQIRERIQKALIALNLDESYILNGFKDAHELNKLRDANASIRALENIASISDLYPHKNTELDIGDGHLKISWQD